jgi:hypothetical protein
VIEKYTGAFYDFNAFVLSQPLRNYPNYRAAFSLLPGLTGGLALQFPRLSFFVFVAHVLKGRNSG